MPDNRPPQFMPDPNGHNAPRTQRNNVIGSGKPAKSGKRERHVIPPASKNPNKVGK